MKKKLPSVPRASADPQRGALAVTAVSAPLLARLQAHRAMMAPHQIHRHTGQLLVESIAEIQRLSSLLRPWMLGESHDLRAENDSLRAGLQRVRDLCTTDHESKEAFIARVKTSLPNPELTGPKGPV